MKFLKNVVIFLLQGVLVNSLLFAALLTFAPAQVQKVAGFYLETRYENLVMVDSYDLKGNGEQVFSLYTSRDGKTAHITFHGGKQGSTFWGDDIDACETILMHNADILDKVEVVYFHCCYEGNHIAEGAGEMDVRIRRGENWKCSIRARENKDSLVITPDIKSLVKETLLSSL